MDLERRAIEIRPRSAWEACDLGIQMGRRWWWPMVQLWLVLAAPWVLLSWLLPARWVMLPALLFWLGKPLWERFLLHYLSQAIFATEPALSEVLKHAPRLLAKDWLASILWRRLSLWRAYNGALTVLEGQTGRARRQRLGHLAGDNASTASKVAILLAHMEGFLLLGVLLIAYTLTPNNMEWDYELLRELPSWDVIAALYNTLYVLVSAVVAPFYVATGFALYLNRRIWLEAWDIDISFRAMAKRLQPALALILFCALALPSLTPKLHANDPPAAAGASISQGLQRLAQPALLFPELPPVKRLAAHYPEERAQVLKALAGPAFHHTQTRLVHHWRWKWQRSGATDAPNLPWQKLAAVIARAFEVMLWALVLALVVWFARNYRPLLARFGVLSIQNKQSRGPLQVFGLDISPANLPKHPDQVALQLCLAGDFRQCLALLYRATLVSLTQRGLELKSSHTEEDCLALASRNLALTPAALAYLRQLTDSWQLLAYGHIAPAAGKAEQLCRSWGEHYRSEEPVDA